MKIEISSRANPRLKELLASKEKLFLFEGEKLVSDILSRDLVVNKLIYSAAMEKRLPKISAAVGEQWLVSRPVLKKISDLKDAPEIMAILEIPVSELDFTERKIVFGFDSLQDPANLGAVFRCAAAFGISALALAGASVRTNNPKVVRAAQTALMDVPFEVFSDLENLISRAQARGAHVYVTGSRANDKALVVEKMEFPCLLLFGNEGHGLAQGVSERFPLIRLEQSERIESLNVAVSACILMHEVRRIHGL